ncbi:MAG: hypothetical protein ACOCRK_03690 [bacterium]
MKYKEFYGKDVKALGMKLLMIPRDGNWNYYLWNNTVHFVAKPTEQGCSDGTFGNINYFRKWFKKEYDKDSTLDGTLTAEGFRVLEGIV